jgi:hypothetical protein
MLFHVFPQSKIRPFSHLLISYFMAVVVSALLLFSYHPKVYSAQMTLAWDPNTEPDLGGYKVYYGPSSGTYVVPLNVGDVTNYTLTGLTEGQVYYAAVTACDQSGNESAYSDEVSGAAREPTQTYTVATNPPGLQIIVDGATYTTPKNFSWIPGTSHILSVESPQSGPTGVRYAYASWSDGGDQSHTMVASASNTALMATFNTQYSLTPSIHPAGRGMIAPSETNWFDEGKSVFIMTAANAGYRFSGWSGEQSGLDNPTSLVMNGPKAVTANFTSGPYTLTVHVNPLGSGSVTKNPDKPTYFLGEQVSLTAAAHPNWAFRQWAGDIGGSQNPMVISVNGNKNIGVDFDLAPETVSTPNGPSGSREGTTGMSYLFETAGSTSSFGDPVQYLLNWGDGTDSGWMAPGTTTASHSWNTPGAYPVRSQARCSKHPSAVSNWSEPMTIVVKPSSLTMIGAIDHPVGGQRVSGITTIDGWALDGRGIKKVELFVDDQFVGNIAYGSTLMDIKEAYPDYPDAENSGFCVVWNASDFSPGDHKIKVILHNLDGYTQDLEVSATVVKFHGEFVESISPSGNILYYNEVTAEGTTQMYDIGIEWSKVSQGFVITEIIPR